MLSKCWGRFSGVIVHTGIAQRRQVQGLADAMLRAAGCC